MSDVVFIALIIVVFAVLALVVRGVECLVGQGSGGDAASGTVAGGDSRPELDGRAER